jgi:tRNA-splicing ligase RtcB (3'-phosphate/5'-hydroxy nucleic acid ligase)
LAEGEIVVGIHCGSRGLGHQIATDLPQSGVTVPDLDLACAPIHSQLGVRYLGSMRAAINCALANWQIITHLAPRVFGHLLPQAKLSLLFDVSATRAFGAQHVELPPAFQNSGQPAFIGGSMGTRSAVTAGVGGAGNRAFAFAVMVRVGNSVGTRR